MIKHDVYLFYTMMPSNANWISCIYHALDKIRSNSWRPPSQLLSSIILPYIYIAYQGYVHTIMINIRLIHPIWFTLKGVQEVIYSRQTEHDYFVQTGIWANEPGLVYLDAILQEVMYLLPYLIWAEVSVQIIVCILEKLKLSWRI